MEYSNADPMEILSRDECHEIIAKYLKSANFILQNYRIERINDAGVIGFMGEYYWLIICITLDQQIKNIQFFIKSSPRNNEDKKSHVKIYFEIECRVYGEIFEEFDADGDCKWRPKHFLLRDDCVVLENLQDCGYKNKAIYGMGLDQQHMESVLKSLAEMHANSFALEGRGTNIATKYQTLLAETSVTSENVWFTYEMDAIKYVAHNTPELQHYIDSINTSFFDEILQQMIALFKKSTKYRNVFSHGDPWISNMMFKYLIDNKGCETLQHAILLDFQLCRYLPPAIDVLLSIFLNTRRENREQHLEYYLEFYWHHLQSELASRKWNIDEELPWDEFKESCQYYKYLVVVFNCRYIFSKMKPGTLQAIERDDPEKYSKICSTDRGKLTIEIMEKDAVHREIALEIFGEFLENVLLLNKK